MTNQTKKERSADKPAQAKQRRSPKNFPVDDSEIDVKTPDRKAGAGASKRTLRAARKGGVELEDSRGKASRKSTRGTKGRVVTVSRNEEGVESKRKGEGRVKPAANLTLQASLRARSPQTRAQRGGPSKR